jgi:hypothetical protein
LYYLRDILAFLSKEGAPLDKNKILESIHIDLIDEQLVVKYKNKTLGTIKVDMSQLIEENQSDQKVKINSPLPIKQYVEGCDMGWC